MRYLPFVLSLLLILSAVNLQASVIHVPGDSTTIQGGINGAANGDTVMVAPGTYYEYEIDFLGKSITVMGTDPEDPGVVEATIVDADSLGMVFYIHSGEDQTSVLTGFTIQGGLFINGGGIYCDNASPTIMYNVIVGNSANGSFPDGKGGGIYCRDSDPIITRNTIAGNSSGQSGGGIRLEHFSSIVSYNIIAENSTMYAGGGISLYSSAGAITDNTITGNQVTNNPNGGGIYCYDSSPMITNTILWGNLPDEIYSGDPTVRYSDIENGWPGLRNINADPLFTDPENGDYCLSEGSPCIDAGDPESPSDPDGTRADIGACYFDQGPLGELSLWVEPDTTYFLRGDSLCFTATITNNTDSTIFFQGWTESETPWGTLITPLLGPVLWVLGPQKTMSPHICRQQIPDNAPFGSPYTYIVKAGTYPDSVIDEDSFVFAIVPPVSLSLSIKEPR